MLASNDLYYLGLDIVAKIISYLQDPRDLEALYQVDPWLTKNIYKRCIKKLYIDPDQIIPIDYHILYKYPKLVSARCDIKINYKLELYDLLSKNIKELCIRIGSSNGPSLISTINTLISSNLLALYKYRLEKYNPTEQILENVWIGCGKLAVSNTAIFSYIMLYKNYITEILLDVSLWNDANALDILATIPNLKHITYIEFGYYPCNALELYSMLNVNVKIQSIDSLMCSFDYSIDPEKIWSEIDDLILLCTGQSYPNITTLYLPLSYEIYNDNINNIFPNLTNTGCRYIYDINMLDIINTKDNTQDNRNISNIFTNIWNNYLKCFDHIKIFLYITVSDIEVRKIFNRDPEIKEEVSQYISNMIFRYSSKIEVINTNYLNKSLIQTLDEWLFY